MLKGVVTDIYHQNDDTDFVLFMVEHELGLTKASGVAKDLYIGDVVAMEGDYSEFRGEKQFKAKSIAISIPTDERAIERYLASGRIEGISDKMAGKLVAHFGKDTLTIIKNDPDQLANVPGFGKKRVAAIKAAVQGELGYKGLDLFLRKFDITKRIIDKLSDSYGMEAIDKIKANPYQITFEIDGFGFETADKIAQGINIEADDPMRIGAGLMFTLNSIVFSDGDTIVCREKLVKNCRQLLSKRGMVNPADIEASIDTLVEHQYIARYVLGEKGYLAPVKILKAEYRTAEALTRIASAYVRSYQDVALDTPLKLHEQQEEAVVMGLGNALSIVTGGPGTGKTTILNTVLNTLRSQGVADGSILLCAPTGKAAKRMAESCKRDAVTLHRALQFSPGDGGFHYNEENPLPYEVIVIDEASMIDVLLSSWFFTAVKPGTRVLIVGDVDQLTSVGPGKVLYDLIESNVIPVTRLTKIFRQSEGSKIIVNAHRINKGEMPVIDHSHKDNDFWFIPAANDRDIANKCIEFIGRLSSHYDYDKKNDIQILSPQRKGDCGQYRLNELAQKAINPAEAAIKLIQDGQDVEYRLGDKVMQIQNNYNDLVFNGEVGFIQDFEAKSNIMSLTFDNALVAYERGDLKQIRLAYCITIHKSQGSEYPCVIIPLTKSHFNMLNRNLLYTAVTRGKSNVVIIGSKQALEIAVKRVLTDKRDTALKDMMIKLAA